MKNNHDSCEQKLKEHEELLEVQKLSINAMEERLGRLEAYIEAGGGTTDDPVPPALSVIFFTILLIFNCLCC